jgi:hypothetical protein
MRCEEMRDHIIEIVYDEGGSSPANIEAQEHVRICAACRGEVEELRNTRKYLQFWKDEAPLRKVKIAECNSPAPSRFNWNYLRYGAIAAMVVLSFLALINAQITWNRDGFAFSTRLIPGRESMPDAYTKSEVRDLMKRALDDSESRMNEASYLMMQKMLDTVEQDRLVDFRLVRGHAARIQNNN